MVEGPFGNIEVDGPFSNNPLEIEARAVDGFTATEDELEQMINNEINSTSLKSVVIMDKTGEVVVRLTPFKNFNLSNDLHSNIPLIMIEEIINILREEAAGGLDEKRSVLIF